MRVNSAHWSEFDLALCPERNNNKLHGTLKMNALLKFSATVDALNGFVGRYVKWLILGAVLVSAGNATTRYLFNIASNAMLELQWYLYAAVFTLAAGYVLKVNEHVRIDVMSQRMTPRTRNWVDFWGFLLFVLPVTLYITLQSIPNLIETYQNQEVSQNAGGLIRWPVRLMIPVGFGLLFIQACSELIKRWAFLKGMIEDPLLKGGHATVDMDDQKESV